VLVVVGVIGQPQMGGLGYCGWAGGWCEAQ
jgi:hypothetical protein